MDFITIVATRSFAQPDFLPGFLATFGLLIFSLFFFWIIRLPLKRHTKTYLDNFPLDPLHLEEPQYVTEMTMVSNISLEPPISRTKKYIVYALCLILCGIPMSKLLFSPMLL